MTNRGPPPVRRFLARKATDAPMYFAACAGIQIASGSTLCWMASEGLLRFLCAFLSAAVVMLNLP